MGGSVGTFHALIGRQGKGRPCESPSWDPKPWNLWEEAEDVTEEKSQAQPLMQKKGKTQDSACKVGV